ncbi:MAG TPA: DUF447 domain-containing protein [Stellaceae bacterium]|nr:DUF447 domain-containing protein [Stellaceae bacterium]
MIRESIITTLSGKGEPHIVPMGVIWRAGLPTLAPFHPSRTLENLREHPYAVINLTDDVRVFAGGVTGRRDWPVRPAEVIRGVILEGALSHQEIEVTKVEEDPVRPRFHCRVVHEAAHASFRGFNRAQAAVIEGAILISRLELLPMDKVEREMAYLAIAIEKTAGPIEQEAWGWLQARLREFRREGEHRS